MNMREERRRLSPHPKPVIWKAKGVPMWICRVARADQWTPDNLTSPTGHGSTPEDGVQELAVRRLAAPGCRS